MKKFNTSVAGVAFMAILSLSTPALAQMADPNGGQAAYAPPTASSTAYGTPAAPTSMEEWVLARGTADEIAQRKAPPSAPRYLVREDDITVMNRQQWHDRGWNDASFDHLKYQSASLCTRTLSYAARGADLMQRYAATQPRIADIAVRYDKMRRKIKTAGLLRTLGNVVAPVIGFLAVGPAYGGIVAAGALGGEAQGHASTKQQLLANDAGQLNNELTGLYVDGTLLWFETYEDYLRTFTDYCTAPTVVTTLNLTYDQPPR